MPKSPLFPKTIVLPKNNSLKIVYLDLNHWIRLSKLRLSSKESGTRNLFDEILVHMENNRACFPLSFYTFVELAKNSNYEQRKRLGHAIEQVSLFFVVTSLHVVASHEVEALFNKIIGPNPNPFGFVRYLDWGVMRSAGLDGRLRVINGKDKDVTEAYIKNYPDKEFLLSKLREASLNLNRSVIEGPSPGDEAEFRANGWNPENLLEQYKKMAEFEKVLVKELDEDPKYRCDSGLLRNLVSARYICHLLNDTFWEGLRNRGVERLEEVFRPDSDDICQMDRMPSFDVFVSLMTSLHKNPNHGWKENHIHDIFALALTVPYCDIVLTDREMVSHVRRTGVDQRMDTVVLSKLEDLSEHL